jgi:hypothetical protein
VTNLLLLIFINSCSNLGLTKTQPTPSQSNITEIPTQIISTPTKTPVVVRPPEKQDEFLDQELFDGVWNSDYIQGQKAHWERWIEYWTNAENPLIFEDLQYVLLFDKWNLPVAYYDVNLPKQVTLISTWKDPINSNVVLAFFPINGIEGGFQLDPPDVTKPYHIEPSNEPFILDDQEITTLVWRGKTFARVSRISGETIQGLNPDGDWITPPNPVDSFLEIVSFEEHTYTFEESNVSISFTIETDVTKDDYPVALNDNNNKSERVIAEALSDAIFSSVWKNNHNTAPKDGDYEEFMKKWGQYQATGVNAEQLLMKFNAYWNLDESPTTGYMQLPKEPIRIVFVNQFKANKYPPPVHVSNLQEPFVSWLFAGNGEITIFVGTRSTSRFPNHPLIPGGEELGLSHAICLLFGGKDRTGMRYYDVFFPNNYYNLANHILKILPAIK